MRPRPKFWTTAATTLVALAATAAGATAQASPATHPPHPPAPPGTERVTAHTLRLTPGAEPPSARLADVAWLAGRWVGTGLGGESEEVWLPAAGDRMTGLYTLRRDGEVVFHELMVLVETQGSIELRLRHFNADLTAWEEKESTGVVFSLVRIQPGRLWLRGLTFERLDDDRLRIYLALRTGETTREEVFELVRARI